jgi:hypothetical protein
MTATSDTHPAGDGDTPGPAAPSPDATGAASSTSSTAAASGGAASEAGAASGAAGRETTPASGPAADPADEDGYPADFDPHAPADPDAVARAAARRGPARKPAKEPFQAMVLTRRYPAWGAASLGLLVAGVVAGYVMLVGLGGDVMHRCSDLGPAACDPRDQARAMALPVFGMVVGLVISLFGGRLLARTGRDPMPSAWVGWAAFLVSVVVTAFLIV